jgi:hypothetical protein
MPKIDFTREEVKEILPSYFLIRDCVKGEQAIKKAKDKYLPRPNAADVSPENRKRFDAYVERAVFYNATQRTLCGLAGQIFTKEPIMEMPSLLEPVKVDADGGGVDLIQMAKRAVLHVLAYGRCGMLVDYPKTEKPATRAELQSGDIKPTIEVFAPWQIRNWRTITRGSKKLLSLVVLEEDYLDYVDKFESKKYQQWRVLELTDAGYCVSVWRKESGDFKMVEGPDYPLDASGTPMQEILFNFIGSENNDEAVDLPPLYDIASLNIAHYRNSADYEESCFLVGQPTPVFSGLTEQWVKEVIKGTVTLGSRGAIPLPVGGAATLLQASENTMPIEAMREKEKQMIALGAKLVEQSQVMKTATEVSIDDVSEKSTLSSSAKNVTSIFEWALKKCAGLIGVSDKEIKFKLHTDFEISRMNAQDRAQLIAEWQAGAIAFPEVREVLRKIGVASMDDKEAKAQIDKEIAAMPDLTGQHNTTGVNGDVNKQTGKGGANNA